MSILRTIGIVILALLIVGYIGLSMSPIGKGLLPTGAGITAKQLCSLVFVSGLEPQRARDLYLDPLLAEAALLMTVTTDTAQQSVTVNIPGFVKQRAFHRPGLGCTLAHDQKAGLQPAPGAKFASATMLLDEGHRDTTFDASKLNAAIEQAFYETPGEQPINTLAVVVLHNGKLVAERYAPGITPETRLPGWSMTKSVTATLLGILADAGKIDVGAPGALTEWRRTDDPRSEISIDQLLRMTSGLAIAETNSGYDPSSRMLFQVSDGAHFSATRALQKQVGTHYEYMSGSTVLAMRAFQEVIGGDLAASSDAIQELLFDPLNMQSAIIEPDQSGTFVGSSFMLASARDWARFGQLYVDGGVANGKRIISEDWIDYVTTYTDISGDDGYGAGFWLASKMQWGAVASRSALPPDTFSANGFQGQLTHIIPSKNLVVVRLGATNFRGHDFDALPLQVVRALGEE